MSLSKTIYFILLSILITAVMSNIFYGYSVFKKNRDFVDTLQKIRPLVTSELINASSTRIEFRAGSIDLDEGTVIVRNLPVKVNATFKVREIEQVDLVRGGAIISYPVDGLIELIVESGDMREVYYYVE